MTSSAAAVSINKLNGTGLVMDEKNWTDVEFLTSEKPPTWGYPASKTLAEKAAWKFAEENNIDLITVIPSLMITGNKFLINGLKDIYAVGGNTSVAELAKFLNKRYPQYQVPTDCGDFPSKAKLVITSEKLSSEGFSFKYGIEEIYDQTVEYFKANGLLN
ncbi:hypothetical protein NC653_027127 [Populus alba x Populus x berolinensis]|uniref:Anthocyanidin reductase n=1 Tax=Populus alba x Populus x berolinensis TaxID=444605 RepID=A0AAD6M4U8_9ROSI|nr:hypothetical protein NC653_027127 [Populus alba x Populus x berolinensis]